MMRLRIPFLALSLLTASALAAETPAHYIVFTSTAGGDPVPVFHRRVTLESLPASKSEADLLRVVDRRDSEEVAFSVTDRSGKTVYRDVAAASSWVRGEFHGARREDGRFGIDGHLFPAARTSFVLRLPALPGARLTFAGGTKASYDLDALAAEADSLPLAPLAALAERPGSVAGLDKAGSPANRVDLLILGDGYTAAQAAKFAADVTAVENQFFGISPYKEYKSHVNVLSLFTPSAQSGADHPPFRANCVAEDPTCCADPEAQTDPLAGTYADTALGGRFCSFNLHRLVVADEAAVLAAASAVPNWDRILVLINDTTYGGSGGSMLVSTLHPQVADLVRHEYAHSFTGLADEYDPPFPGYPECSDVSGSVPCEANVTDELRRSRLKWAPYVANSTPLPTPEGNPAYSGKTGLFEGARYRPSGMYRHRDADCLMLALGQPFRDVCRQEYVLQLYRGGWGTPSAGIDPIEPGSESPRPGNVRRAPSITFNVKLLQPSSGPKLTVRWFVDGVQVAGATGPRFVYRPAGRGAHTVEVRVRDTTPFVHASLAGNDLQSTRRWRVTAATARSAAEAVEIEEIEAGAGVPAPEP